MEAGKWGSVGALVILYLQSQHVLSRIVIVMVCGFGFILSYTLGSIFSFGYLLPPLVLGIYMFFIHYSLQKLNLHKGPGNFFFIMLATLAISTPKNSELLANNVGYVAIGVMLACIIGVIYSLLTLKEKESPHHLFQQITSPPLAESLIFGATIGLSLLIAKYFQLDNPYWVPISCTAVMQGISTSHVWERALQRIAGIFIGLVLVWVLLQYPLQIIHVCICILILQIIVEFFVVRNYGIAAIFITMLTIFLAEPNLALTQNSDFLIKTRLWDTLLGSLIGAFGGWALYHEKLQFFSKNS